MGSILQVVAAVLIAVVLGLTLDRQFKELSILLNLAVCCMVAYAAVCFLEPLLDFWQELQQLGQLDGEWIQILMKAVGIGLICELANLVCADAGNAALGKAIQLFSAAAMLWLSVPLLRRLIELVQEILGEV